MWRPHAIATEPLPLLPSAPTLSLITRPLMSSPPTARCCRQDSQRGPRAQGVGRGSRLPPNQANKQLFAGGPILGGRIQAGGSNRFPLIPTHDSEVERKRPAVWLWTLIDLFVTVVVLIWLLRLQR